MAFSINSFITQLRHFQSQICALVPPNPQATVSLDSGISHAVVVKVSPVVSLQLLKRLLTSQWFTGQYRSGA